MCLSIFKFYLFTWPIMLKVLFFHKPMWCFTGITERLRFKFIDPPDYLSVLVQVQDWKLVGGGGEGGGLKCGTFHSCVGSLVFLHITNVSLFRCVNTWNNNILHHCCLNMETNDLKMRKQLSTTITNLFLCLQFT